MRNHIEHFAMLVHRFFERIRINDPAAHAARFSGDPAIFAVFFVLLEDELTTFTLVKVAKLWISALHLFKKMQNRFSLVRKIHLSMQVHIDVKIIAQ